jgi:hypothetical protein
MNRTHYTRLRKPLAVLTALALALCLSPAVLAQTGPKPNLHIVAAGVSEYTDIAPLFCAHKDALDVVSFYRRQEGSLFGRVEATTFINQQATVANLQGALAGLQSRAKPGDVAVVFFAGHGGKSGHPEYGYCAFDKDLTWTQIQHALRAVPCKVIVILDTCQAGSATLTQNVIVLSSSQAHQDSDEDRVKDGNGFFTKALLEALRGRADYNTDGTVTLEETHKYVVDRVPQISGGKQLPMLICPPNATSAIPLAKLAPGTLPTSPPTVAGPTVPPVAVPVHEPMFQSSGPLTMGSN